ncbi:periplasmic component of amino acid ABC-type transporter/signal transduction system [Burkholderia sp. Ch1-1]|uniref:Periplasmic component of amino acid ABC-type transporter/signal transduction system n=1 Tax=Paraburkholderia dioscoreae TaxID=2604047 RepID=A0A5Q4Z1Z1_9BURK|nr:MULTISPECIES: ABC transporter substrate-binding protein [Paraburkholderia]EIF31518.1 periplasmic component of amino acid ABC-type transporter/signal transduction system [Burkholderia sp. Ch1-1]MDR8398158.1 ABC transporter substrate-binding protein [Paraburkholderia sp. USG1]VVD28224.1 Periplasmic component of amino acid ABC-type transporter/signal transduction system [Paraburkholderia dioscoreae]
MTTPIRFTRIVARLTVAATLGLSVTPSFAEDAPNIDSIPASPELSALVPEFYRQKQPITVAVNPEIAPVKFIDEDGDVAGFAPDLVSAAAKVLGLKIRFVQASFDSLIPGLAANRFDVLLSLGDFPSRHSKVTFIDYLNVGQTIVASPKRQLTLKSLDDLCGMRIALPRGTAPLQRANEVSSKCVANGKKAISIATYPDTNMTLMSLTNEASQAVWVDSPAANYNIKKFPDKYQAVYYYDLSSYGIGFGVDDNGKRLAHAFQQALIKLQQQGFYQSVMQKWGLPAKDGRPTFPVNDPQM